MTKTKTLALAAACTMTGAGGALGVDAISSSANFRHHGFHSNAGFFLGRAVHAEAVLATRDGFKNATYDRGVVKSVSGGNLTLTEGKGTTTREESISIPSDARVKVPNKDNATLADVQAGWKAFVLKLGSKTVVFAHPPRS